MFKVMKTEMWPAQWFGGPTHKGLPTSNATCYYWRTEADAQKFCNRMNALEEELRRMEDTKLAGCSAARR